MSNWVSFERCYTYYACYKEPNWSQLNYDQKVEVVNLVKNWLVSQNLPNDTFSEQHCVLMFKDKDMLTAFMLHHI